MKLSKFCNKISLILQALWCAVLYFLIEALCRHSVVEAWDYMTGKPLVFAYNTMFIFTTMLIVYLFHRRCFLESCGFRFLAVSGNRKLYSSDEPCYTIYRTGSAYADGWYCNHAEISAVLWCGDRMYFDRNCGAGAFDPTGQGTEV